VEMKNRSLWRAANIDLVKTPVPSV